MFIVVSAIIVDKEIGQFPRLTIFPSLVIMEFGTSYPVTLKANRDGTLFTIIFLFIVSEVWTGVSCVGFVGGQVFSFPFFLWRWWREWPICTNGTKVSGYTNGEVTDWNRSGSIAH